MTENGSINLNLRLFLELLIGDIVETVVASFFANRVIYPKRGLGADKTADHQKISCHALTLIETLFRNVFHVKQGAAVKLIPEFGSAANKPKYQTMQYERLLDPKSPIRRTRVKYQPFQSARIWAAKVCGYF